jgi:hypothetical protein
MNIHLGRSRWWWSAFTSSRRYRETVNCQKLHDVRTVMEKNVVRGKKGFTTVIGLYNFIYRNTSRLNKQGILGMDLHDERGQQNPSLHQQLSLEVFEPSVSASHWLL